MLTNWLESLASEIETTTSCLHAQSPKSSCSRCVSACPENAITIAEAGVKIDHALCTKCAECIPVCPVQAIHGRSPERKVIKDLLLVDEGIFPGVEELLYFYKKGAKRLFFGLNCEDMPDSLNMANCILGDLGLTPFTVVAALPEKEYGTEYSRRDFFNKALLESRKLAAKTLSPAKWRFNHHEFDMAGMFPEFALYEADLERNKCTLCEGCFKMCKQQVYTIHDGVLEINHGNCNGCGLCVDLCDVEAVQINLKAHLVLREEVTLSQNLCGDCGTAYFTWEQSDTAVSACPSCESRKSLGYLSPFNS
ncbi:4Fe-4S dicluster domain-containing protein [Bacillus sp. FJAT-27445]|uniref:4Fe-4S binding protein n=1 Tax=Bacillus sp. FJAT-27445 TaxID=1679166 RepID=UPI0020A47797|nr:4Fe-4S dicluster domain-containing protein [Bacillus sp. FJAT-27445]